MRYELRLSYPTVCSNSWEVSAIDDGDTGKIFITLFPGSDGEQRAREYAAWKNGEITSPTHQPPFTMD